MNLISPVGDINTRHLVATFVIARGMMINQIVVTRVKNKPRILPITRIVAAETAFIESA